MCADTPSLLPSVFDLATLRLRDQAEIARLTEQVDLYRVKHAELEAECERLCAENRQLAQLAQAMRKLQREAASPVANIPAEDRFYEAVEAGEVRG